MVIDRRRRLPLIFLNKKFHSTRISTRSCKKVATGLFSSPLRTYIIRPCPLWTSFQSRRRYYCVCGTITASRIIQEESKPCGTTRAAQPVFTYRMYDRSRHYYEYIKKTVNIVSEEHSPRPRLPSNTLIS